MTLPTDMAKNKRKIKVTDEWQTMPSTSDTGRLVIITLRTDIDEFINSKKYNYRVEIVWNYNAHEDGMPTFEDSSLMEKATEALNSTFNDDPVAIMTGIYTGDGERDWVFYTCSLNIFQKKFNQSLINLPEMPLNFYAEEDPEWAEYKQTAYIE